MRQLSAHIKKKQRARKAKVTIHSSVVSVCMVAKVTDLRPRQMHEMYITKTSVMLSAGCETWILPSQVLQYSVECINCLMFRLQRLQAFSHKK